MGRVNRKKVCQIDFRSIFKGKVGNFGIEKIFIDFRAFRPD